MACSSFFSKIQVIGFTCLRVFFLKYVSNVINVSFKTTLST